MAKMPMKKDPKTGKMMPAFMVKKKNGNGKTKNGMKNGAKKNGNGMNGLTAAQKNKSTSSRYSEEEKEKIKQSKTHILWTVIAKFMWQEIQDCWFCHCPYA